MNARHTCSIRGAWVVSDNESRHMWMCYVTFCMNAPSHVTYERVMSWLMSRMNEWIMSRMNESRLCCWGRAGRVRQWACHVWMHHITHMNESCHIYECVMSHSCAIWGARVVSDHESCHIWLCHLSRIKESCHAYEWVVSQRNSWRTCAIWLVQVVSANESRNIWICHISHMNGSCHAYE